MQEQQQTSPVLSVLPADAPQAAIKTLSDLSNMISSMGLKKLTAETYEHIESTLGIAPEVISTAFLLIVSHAAGKQETLLKMTTDIFLSLHQE